MVSFPDGWIGKNGACNCNILRDTERKRLACLPARSNSQQLLRCLQACLLVPMYVLPMLPVADGGSQSVGSRLPRAWVCVLKLNGHKAAAAGVD